MSFVIDGQTWTPETALQHAQEMLATINAVRQSQQLPILTATTANAIWLVLLAAGARNQQVDEEINTGLNSLNPALCDDQQILNILPMVGTVRTPATFSTVTVTVTVTDTGAPITIPAGSVLPFGSVNFLTDTLYTNVTPPSTFNLLCTCDTLGEIVCPANSLTQFSISIANVDAVNNAAAAVVGVNEETISHVRQRIITGDVIPYGVNASIRSIRSLTGITTANVFFNPSTTTNLVLTGAITIPPRQAYIIVAGDSGEIANAYYQSMTAPTQGGYSQIYTTLAGQNITVLYDIATAETVYVKVYYDNNAPFQTGADTVIKQNISTSASGILPGQEITSQYFSEVLSGFTLATITGISVSLDDVTYSRFVILDANKYASITTAHVTVIGE